MIKLSSPQGFSYVCGNDHGKELFIPDEEVELWVLTNDNDIVEPVDVIEE